jgi:hypothetical protein
MPELIQTCDPYVWIEDQRRGYIRYRNVVSGRRWEVLGTCIYEGNANGPCSTPYEGQPLGPPEGRLDVPIAPELICELCVDSGTLTFSELEPVPRRVVIPVLNGDDPAALALKWERLFPEVYIVDGEYGYGELLARTWAGERGFCLVERDIVPWPGAIQELWECPKLWCGYKYMLGRGCLGPGLGCVRFSDELVRSELVTFADVPWHEMDGYLMRTLGSYHVHEPPVGHAPAYAET